MRASWVQGVRTIAAVAATVLLATVLVVANEVVHEAPAAADDTSVPSCEPHPPQTYDRDEGTVFRPPWPDGDGITCVERHGAAGAVTATPAEGEAGQPATFSISGFGICPPGVATDCLGVIDWRTDSWRFYIPGDDEPSVRTTDFHLANRDTCEGKVLTCTVTLPDQLPFGATHLIGRAEVTKSVATPPELCQERDLRPTAPGCHWVSPDGRETRWVPDVDEAWVIEAALPLFNDQNTAPLVNFTFEPVATGPYDIAFTARASDGEDSPDQLRYSWSFDDGKSSTDRNPVHTFPGPGEYTVTLRVVDTGGLARSATKMVKIQDRDTVVNSTGDASATDPRNLGCDTGGSIGDDPECTLRAALETVTAEGGGEITFDIDTGDVPTIALGSDPLPEVPASTTIDGTSQSVGQVAVDGGGAEKLLTLTGSGTTIEGLVLDNATSAIYVDGGDGASIKNNVLGADATGTTPGTVDLGVQVKSGNDVTVSENVIGAETGVLSWNVAAGVQVTDNDIGVHKDGAAVLGSTRVGVAVIGPSGAVSGNTVHGSEVGIGVLTAAATGAEVRNNRIGVAGGEDVVLDGGGQGVRIDGAPDATVAGNVISSARDDVPGDIGAVVVIGDQQVFDGADGLVFPNRSVNTSDSPTTATDIAITGNVIGDSAVTGGGDDSGAKTGILVWGDPIRVSVTDNLIGSPERGVELYGGSAHSVLDNRIGVDANDAPAPVREVGVLTTDVTGSVIGANGRGNTVHTDAFGITQLGGSDGLIVANQVTSTGENVSFARGGCITVEDEARDVTVQQNTVIDCTPMGIGVFPDTVDVAVNSNVVQDPATGLQMASDGAEAKTNIVLGATDVAIAVLAEDTTLEGNLLGTSSRNGAIQPFEGTGIKFSEGSGSVDDNVIAGAEEAGIEVATDGVVTLRGNRLKDIGGGPIVAPNGPDSPTIAAAIRSVAPDDSTRTTLVISGLPEDDAGEIEVFANDDCDPDGEAHEVLGVIKTKKLDRNTMIVQLIDRDADNFTATYTDSGGTTSALSPCAPIRPYPDSDGDGSVDPIDDLTGGAGDPTRGVIITDDEQILEVSTNSRRLTGLAAVDDPAPDGHPGVDLPLGTVTFSVEGLPTGGAADVTFLVIDGGTMSPDATYWKFAPPTVGAAPSWFDFSFDADTGLGARTLDPVDVPGFGFRRPLVVSFQDGALGDADEFPNGTVLDPGAVAVPNGSDPPPTPTSPPNEPADSSAPADPTGIPPSNTSGDQPVVGSGTLPRTGGDPLPLVGVALVTLALGLALVALPRIGTLRLARSGTGHDARVPTDFGAPSHPRFVTWLRDLDRPPEETGPAPPPRRN